MTPKSVIFVIFLLPLMGLSLELKKKAYEDLVVSLSDSIPVDDCKTILRNLEHTLKGASQYLFSALDGRVYLGSATVLLPLSWPDSCAPAPVSSGTGETPDVTVLPTGPTRGSVWTQQSLGCGQPGDQIYLGYEELRTRNDQLGRTLVKEFAMYRYGVFEEQGYSNDPIYPMCYFDDESKEAKATGCSDLPINDNGICQGDITNYNTTKMVNPDARSSIMFAPEAPSVSMFCDQGTHNRFAPTKHNLMCQNRNTLEVILGHPDFASGTVENAPHSGGIIDTTPKISYKKQNFTRYVLVIESTKDMLQRESWNYLRFAVRKWAVHDLPDNTEVGLVLMNDTGSQISLTLKDLKSSINRDLVASSIPYTPGDSTQAGCLHCALRDATDMLRQRDKTHGPARNVILVVAPGTVMNQHLKIAMKEVKRTKIRVAAINYPNILRSSMLDILADETGGESFTVFEEKLNVETTLLTTYFKLSNVLYNIVQKFYSGNPADLPIEIHRREIVDDGRSSLTASFMLDENMGEPARFMLYTHNSDAPLIRGLKLVSPTHQTYERTIDNMLNFKIITIASNISETGTWTYTIEPYTGNPQPHFLQVMATPRSPSAPVVQTKFWMHRNQPGSPLILLTEVKHGQSPVLGAKVEVTVMKHEANGSVLYKEHFELLDTGSGDPDVTKGDGVYTRYFSAANGGPGIYVFEVLVTDNGNTAYSYEDTGIHKDNAPCCGSTIPPPKKQPISPFQRHLPPITLQITSDDILRASQSVTGRIGDLKAQIFPSTQQVRLTWTAPDMGGQTVSGYEVKYAASARDVLDNLETAGKVWDNGTPFILAPGSETTFTMDFAQEKQLQDKPLYFLVRAFGHAYKSQSGTVSNWVRVFVPSPPPPPTAPPTYASNDQSSWPFQTNSGGDRGNPSVSNASSGFGLEIILPVVIGFILLSIVLVLYCYFCIVKRRKHTHNKKPSKNDKLNSTITIIPSSPVNQPSPTYTSQPSVDTPDHHTVGVPINNYGYEDDTKKRYSLVHQQEQQLIEELKQQHSQRDMVPNNNYAGLSVISSSTLQRGHTLSPYNSWSASQLLHEHERRHSPMQDEQMIINGMQVDQMSLNAPSMDHVSLNGGHYAHPPPVPPLPTFTSNGYPVGNGNYNIYGVHPAQQPIYQTMQRSEPFPQSLQGSMSSVNSGDKKRRNVTMV